MKARIFVSVLSLLWGVAQAQDPQDFSESTASTSGIGNQQTINFNTPAQSTTTVNSNLNGTTRQVEQYTGSYTVKNVPNVAGPNLTTSNDTCMGSSSGGAAGAGFGVSFGTTWTDDQCKRLKMSRELWNKGMRAASLAMDCMDPAAREALEITGTKCPQSMNAQERQAAFGAGASLANAVQGPAPAPKPDREADAVSSGDSVHASAQVSDAKQFQRMYPD